MNIIDIIYNKENSENITYKKIDSDDCREINDLVIVNNGDILSVKGLEGVDFIECYREVHPYIDCEFDSDFNPLEVEREKEYECLSYYYFDSHLNNGKGSKVELKAMYLRKKTSNTEYIVLERQIKNFYCTKDGLTHHYRFYKHFNESNIRNIILPLSAEKEKEIRDLKLDKEDYKILKKMHLLHNKINFNEIKIRNK